MATTNDLKNGLVLNIDNQLSTVVEFQHVKPGKGPAFVRTKLKNVLSGKVVDRTFHAGLKVETANGSTRLETSCDIRRRLSAPSRRAGSEASDERVPTATNCAPATPRAKSRARTLPTIDVRGYSSAVNASSMKQIISTQ